MTHSATTRRNVLRTLAAAPFAGSLVTLSVLPAHAQAWPGRSIRLVVPFPPGGATDTSARIVAEHLSQRLGKAVVVDNKPGGATVIGMDIVAKAPADGYTLLATGGGSLSVLPALRKDLPYDVVRDYAPITQLVNAPVVLVTPGNRPFMKLADLIAAAKAKPGQLRYATYGAGSAPHLAGELLSSAAGISIEPIPYKGASEAQLALLREEVDLGFETLSATKAHLPSGKLRVLSLNGEQRSAFIPEAPGMAEQGLAAAAMEAFYCLAAPAGTPTEITNRIAKEVREILALPDVREKLASQMLEPAAKGPEAMAALVKDQTAKYKAVAAKAGISLSS